MNEATTETPTRNSRATLILGALAAAICGAVFAGSSFQEIVKAERRVGLADDGLGEALHFDFRLGE